MHTQHPLMMDATVRLSPILGLIRIAQASRMPKPALPFLSRTMEPPSVPVDPLRLEIRRGRARLRAMEHRRDALLVETAALRLWEEAPSEGRVPKWVAEAAIRRRLAEIDELGTEIQNQIARIAQLCNSILENVHGTPSLELEPLPMIIPSEEAGSAQPNRIIGTVSKSASAIRKNPPDPSTSGPAST